MQTLYAMRLEQHAANASAPAAVVLSHCSLSFGDLLLRVRACAAQLAGAGLRPGDVVGITIADEIDHFVTSLALLSLGVAQVCLPTYEPVAKRRDLARRLAVGRVAVVESGHGLPGVEAVQVAIDAGEAAPAIDAVAHDADAPAIYHASSGTTSEPKIYALSQRALAWRAERIIGSERVGSRFRAFSPVSIEDPLSKSRRIYCAWTGDTSAFQSRATQSLSLHESCRRLGVTHLELSILQATSALADADRQVLPAGMVVYATGALVSPRLRREFEASLGVPLLVHYGAREFGRIAADVPGRERYDVEAVGTPVPWIELEIVDAEGRALPAGEVGEIRVRSEQMTRAYHRDPVATSRHIRGDWFYPGDLGSITASGQLRIHGRVDDMMNLSGIKIFPAEIERVLEDCPGVKAAAAFARASAAHGDIPVAAVELHDGASIGADELMAFARQRLGIRAPRKIFVVPSLPRNAAGKIVRRELEHFL